MTSTEYARLAITIAILPAAFLIQGCATSLSEEAQYEQKTLRAERMDEIREFITVCHDAGMIAVYHGLTTNKLRSPLKHIPRHAHPSDYGCASERDIGREMRSGG